MGCLHRTPSPQTKTCKLNIAQQHCCVVLASTALQQFTGTEQKHINAVIIIAIIICSTDSRRRSGLRRRRCEASLPPTSRWPRRGSTSTSRRHAHGRHHNRAGNRRVPWRGGTVLRRRRPGGDRPRMRLGGGSSVGQLGPGRDEGGRRQPVRGRVHHARTAGTVVVDSVVRARDTQCPLLDRISKLGCIIISLQQRATSCGASNQKGCYCCITYQHRTIRTAVHAKRMIWHGSEKPAGSKLSMGLARFSGNCRPIWHPGILNIGGSVVVSLRSTVGG